EQLGFIDHPDGQAMARRLLSRRFPDAPGVRNLPVSGYTNQITLILESVARGIGFTVIPRYARRAFAIQVVENGAKVVDTLWLLHRAEWHCRLWPSAGLSIYASICCSALRSGQGRVEMRMR